MTDDTYDDETGTFTELREIAEVAMPTLSVVVDYNHLLVRYGERDALSIVARLKELLA